MAIKKRYDYVREAFNKLGWTNSKVEYWQEGKTHDLFGCADMLVIAPQRLILIQVCGAGDWKKHCDKIKPLITVKEKLAPTQTLYQIGVEKRRIGNRDRWVYQIGIYVLRKDGTVIVEKLNTFKDLNTNIQVLVDYESQFER